MKKVSPNKIFAGYDLIFDNMEECVVVYKFKNNGKDIIVSDLNKAAERLEKVKRKDVIGKKVERVFRGVKPFGLYDVFRKVWKTGKAMDHPVSFYKDSYHKGWRDNYVFKLPDDGVVAIYSDVSKKMQEQERLKESEEKFKNIFNTTNDVVFIHDLKGKILEVNNIACKRLGYSKKELLLLSPSKIDAPQFRKYIPFKIKKVLTKGFLIFETVHITKSGKEIPVEVSAKQINFGGQKAIINRCRDITERKRNEEKLIESEEKFHSLFDKANDAIWVLDKSIFVDCNPQALKLFGCPKKQQMVNHTPMDFSPEKQPDGQSSRKKSLFYIKNAYNDKPQKFYWHHKNLNGDLIDMEISLNRVMILKKYYLLAIGRDITKEKSFENNLIESKRQLEEAEEVAGLGNYILNIDTGLWKSSFMLDKIFGISNYYQHSVKGWTDMIYPEDKEMMQHHFFTEVLKEHKPFDREYRIIRQSDKAIRWVYGLGRLELNVNNMPVRMIGTIQDITERRERELLLVKAKNDFLSLVAHQLRTPLSASKWVLETLAEGKNFDSKQQKKISDLTSSNERLINLVNDFLDVTKIESGGLIVNKELVCLEKLITELVDSLEPLAKSKGKIIKTVFATNLEKVYCDPVLIHEAVTNLLNNAVYYSPQESALITISVTKEDSGYFISVHNEGVIDSYTAQKISSFEKFSRGINASDKQPSGSGLGLFITRKVIEANGGTVWFESTTNLGTTFYIKIVENKDVKH